MEVVNDVTSSAGQDTTDPMQIPLFGVAEMELLKPVVRSLDGVPQGQSVTGLANADLRAAVDELLEKRFGIATHVAGDYIKAVRGMIDIYGLALAAKVIGVHSGSILKEWLDPLADPPSQYQLKPLLHAWEITQMVAGKGGKKRAKSWMLEPNRFLSDYTPAGCINLDPGLVRQAALHYLASSTL